MIAGVAPCRACAALLLGIVLLTGHIAVAQVAVPSLVGHVTDKTGTLSAAQKDTLEQTLRAFEARNGAQLALLLVPTTESEGIEQYALRVAEQWKLGRKKVDDGMLLVVAKEDRTIRLEIGYGLEGVLSDAESKRIIGEHILPLFTRGDLYAGLEAGVAQIIHRVERDPVLPVEVHLASLQPELEFYRFILFFAGVAFGIVVRWRMGSGHGAVITGIVATALSWWVIGSLLQGLLVGVAAMVVTLLGVTRVLRGVGWFGGIRGAWGGGGGGFGGGGASGRW